MHLIICWVLMGSFCDNNGCEGVGAVVNTTVSTAAAGNTTCDKIAVFTARAGVRACGCVFFVLGSSSLEFETGLYEYGLIITIAASTIYCVSMCFLKNLSIGISKLVC